MADTLNPAQRRAAMGAVKNKDTAPEWAVRRLLHGMGYRYRLHARDLPGCPDLVFPIRRKIVLIHGCFWHGHDCRRGAREPKSNQDYWLTKLSRNKARDERNLAELTAKGWQIMVIWECELPDRDRLISRLSQFLGEARKAHIAPKLKEQ